MFAGLDLHRFHPCLHNRTFEEKSHIMLAPHYYDIGLLDVINWPNWHSIYSSIIAMPYEHPYPIFSGLGGPGSVIWKTVAGFAREHVAVMDANTWSLSSPAAASMGAHFGRLSHRRFLPPVHPGFGTEHMGQVGSKMETKDY